MMRLELMVLWMLIATPVRVNAQPSSSPLATRLLPRSATPYQRGSSSIPSQEYYEPSGEDEKLRRSLWDSPEMLDARKYVLAKFERSAHSSRQQGVQHLRAVSKLPLEDMLKWLRQLQARRAELARQQAVADEARQRLVDQAVQLHHQWRQGPYNADQSKQEMAEARQLELEQRLVVLNAQLERRAQIAAALAAQRLPFDPLAPAVDPVSPSARTRYAAAASLPGDLPRGDPANFSRGDAPQGSSAGGESGGAVAAPTPADGGAGTAAGP